MSDLQNPLDFLYQESLKQKRDLAQLREWIDFMKKAGENVTQQELTYNNTLKRTEKWLIALREKGYNI